MEVPTSLALQITELIRQKNLAEKKLHLAHGQIVTLTEQLRALRKLGVVRVYPPESDPYFGAEDDQC